MTPDFDIAAPDPAGMVASLSSLGYSIEAAVADLVDNSISAKAGQIDVVFTWGAENSWVAVIDNGEGMALTDLITAMTPAARGPASERTAEDLGRFGMGLKTASFSQARQLTVTSANYSGEWHTRTWDLDTVESTREWRLLHNADLKTLEILDQLREGLVAGTVVLWRRLNGYGSDEMDVDQTAQQQFYDEATRVKRHLEMVFARFLKDVDLRIQGQRVQPWDPFLSGHPSVQRVPAEALPLAHSTVKVEAFVLPSAQKLSKEQYDAAGGPNGWLNQQGFYVYRRNRLILAGDWLDLRGLRQEEKYNLVRISVDVPAELDAEWSVDVRKSKVVPPVALRRHLRRIALRAREQGADVIRHRGQIAARQHGRTFVYPWRVDKLDGRIKCRINREHPLVRETLRTSEERSATVKALLTLLEETVPVEALRVIHEADAADDPEPFGGKPNETQEAVASELFAALVNQGKSPEEANAMLRDMDPFNRLSGFWNQ
ncbi:ATP-binding protein [Nonomuraea polychroma]|uniref:ATP-binding protein n=1 Tax=Nonomuraea polychroma TaxID=46176 RepID=UPI0019D42856|nr:ATP-binding protein [Nonomuraea polychroma]